MEIGTLTCPVCRERTSRIKVEHFEGFEILRCEVCDVEFAQPFKAAPPEDYEIGYIERYSHPLREIERLKLPFYDGFMDIYTVILKILQSLPPKGKILDAGCGSGGFLSLLKGMGFQVYGFDISPTAVEMAKKIYELRNVINCSWEALPPEWYGFTVITAIEVVEHLEEPLAFVTRMRDLLSENGIFILSVPNRNRLGEKCVYRIRENYPPYHLTRWSVEALSALLKKAGFKKIIIKPLAPPTVAIKEQIRFSLAPYSYWTKIGKLLTRPLSETFGRYLSFFLRHLLWNKGAYLLGIAR
ncbi:class I SAM-dependent methyltransferase [bacterium]|nr:class I SAM-dependent methyltransferase [bacterium]